MSRATIAVDRFVMLVLAVILIGAGVAAIAWWFGLVTWLPARVDLSGAQDIVHQPWWPWAAGAAGLIYALYQTTIWFFQGFQAGLIAFTAAVMGGIGNLKGAVLGGLIIGIIQQISDNRIGSEWTPAIVFGYLVLVMVFRPQGLIGEETREAG